MGHKQITFDERNILERLRTQKLSMGFCARILGRSVAAISLEIKKGSKNMDRYGRYSAELAQRRTVLRKRRARRKGKNYPDDLLEYIRESLRNYWSPEQIHGRLFVDYPNQPTMRISFKTRYRWLQAGTLSTVPHPWKGYAKFLRLKRGGKSFKRNFSRAARTKGRIAKY